MENLGEKPVKRGGEKDGKETKRKDQGDILHDIGMILDAIKEKNRANHSMLSVFWRAVLMLWRETAWRRWVEYSRKMACFSSGAWKCATWISWRISMLFKSLASRNISARRRISARLLLVAISIPQKAWSRISTSCSAFSGDIFCWKEGNWWKFQFFTSDSIVTARHVAACPTTSDGRRRVSTSSSASSSRYCMKSR